MEIVGKKIVLLSAVLLAFGIAAQLQPKTVPPNRSETWMEQNLPERVGESSFIRSTESPSCSYKMSDMAYEALKPYGIVARIFEKDKTRFDTVVVAANDRISLHDPHDCFPGQDNKIVWGKEIDLPTKSRGNVRAMLMELDTPGIGKRYALYTFRGPSGTFPVRDAMFWDWFVAELKGVRPEGALMRVMTTDEATTEDQLKAFSSEWFDEAYKTSKGIF